MTTADAYIDSLQLFGMRFGLDRMRRLMTALGRPQEQFASIHVVGTNGKSSTTRMIAAILERHGLRTGSYTSPHLVSYAERIQIRERDLDPSAFAAAAALGAEMTVPGVAQTLIFTRVGGRTGLPGKERLAAFAAHGTTMAIFLSVSMIERVVEELRRLGIPVPDALTDLLNQYRPTIAAADEAAETLEYVRDCLSTILDDIEEALPQHGQDEEASRSRAAATRPRGFVLRGTHYPATRWLDLHRELMRVLAATHADEFERVLTLERKRSSRPEFSRDPSALMRPGQPVPTKGASVSFCFSARLMRRDGLCCITRWQFMYIAEGGPTVVIGQIRLFMRTDKPDKTKITAGEGRNWLVSTIAAERRAAEAIRKFTMWQALYNPKVLLLALNYLGIVTASLGMLIFIPQMIKSLGNYSNMTVGWLTMIPYTCGAIAMVTWGRISDRMNERRWNLFFGCVFSTVGLIIAGMTMGTWWALVGMSIAAMGFYGSKGPFFAMPPMFLSGAGLAAGIAWINSIGNLGGFFGPWYVGVMRDLTGNYAGGLYGLALLGLMAAIVGALFLQIPKRAPAAAIGVPAE